MLLESHLVLLQGVAAVMLEGNPPTISITAAPMSYSHCPDNHGASDDITN